MQEMMLTKLSTPAAAAKSLQLRPTLCDPIDGSPPGSPLRGILQARVLEWIVIAFSKIKHSSIIKTVSSIGIWELPELAKKHLLARQEYWNKLPFPPPWDLPNPGIEPITCMSSALAGEFFTTGTTWEVHLMVHIIIKWGCLLTLIICICTKDTY